MSVVFSYPTMLRCAAAAAALAVCSIQASAAGSATAEAQSRYRQDMAQCNSGKSNQDPATCRLEAHNALAAARRGALVVPGADLQSNAQLRCSVHQGVDRSACEARMRGEGTVDGNVAGGGVLREKVIVVPGS
ncbi:MAG: hypothetical protein ABI434_08665 [Burkholderiaceae bacterium]